MGAQVYGRRAIRRFERETGERIVHAVTGSSRDEAILTTIDHRHLTWSNCDRGWLEMEPGIRLGVRDCGLRLASCGILFGDGGHHTEFMRGPCNNCGAGRGLLHRADCAKLADILCWPSINPDYWPRPVCRPTWLDDPRCPNTRTALIHRLAYQMDVPVNLLPIHEGPGWVGSWARVAEAARLDVDRAVAAVAPAVIRSAGLDPDRYTLATDWQPGPYRPEA